MPLVKIGGEAIQSTQTMDYLGVRFSENMEFREHIDKILGKARKTYAMYAKALSGKKGLSKRVRLLIYKQVIRPMLTYAFPIWSSISSKQMERLRLAERRILRRCLGLGPRQNGTGQWINPSCKQLYSESKISKVDRIDVWMTKLAIRFLEQCGHNESGNVLVGECQIGQQEFENIMQSGGALTPMALLNLKNSNRLYDNEGNLIYYHRKYGSYNMGSMVYNTAQ